MANNTNEKLKMAQKMTIFKKNCFIPFPSSFIMALGIFFLLSCHRERRPIVPGSPCTTKTTLSYSDSNCSTTAGCTLTFSCPTLGESGLQKFVGLVTDKLHLSSQALTAGTTPLVISSITTVDTPALLQTTPGLVPQNWYSNATGAVTIDCTNDNGQISCPQFAPVGSQFDIQGTLGGVNTTVHVSVASSITPLAIASLTTGCGQFGTTYQRIFDCSERVTHFAGIGYGGGSSTDFTLGNPDPNWFLVACPVYADGTTSDQCAWLSPVIESGNPVIGININPPNLDTTSPDLGLPNGATRLLWSGLLDNSNQSYNFLDANGGDGNGHVNCNDDISNPQCASYHSGSPIYTFDQFITINFRETLPSAPNICTTQIQSIPADNAFSGMLNSPYTWIVPSYPFLMTLTGSSSSCPYGSGSTTTGRCNGLGFSAISVPTPGFNSNIGFWSSSVITNNVGWFFDAGSGILNSIALTARNQHGVRCASAAW